MTDFEIFRGDITKLDVDAIVNAADRLLLGGGGVDGAIHRAAGPDLLKYCRGLNGCQPGEAKLTPGFNLPARHVIHTVGPIWHGGENGEAGILTACYLNCLAIAKRKQFKAIAFPAISTGIYHFPPEQAAEIAIRTCREEVPYMHDLKQIIFACFDQRMEMIYRDALGAAGPPT